jgi:methionyl-tRNA formyltransferase
LVLRALAENPPPAPQPAEGATYAPKLGRDDGKLDWTMEAAALDRRVRALNPWPGTFSIVDGETLKILRVSVQPGDGPPGIALDDALLVATGAGALRLIRVQAPGRAAMDAESFLRGRKVPAGTRLG